MDPDGKWTSTRAVLLAAAGQTVGRQRAPTWPPLSRISWPPTPDGSSAELAPTCLGPARPDGRPARSSCNWYLASRSCPIQQQQIARGHLRLRCTFAASANGASSFPTTRLLSLDFGGERPKKTTGFAITRHYTPLHASIRPLAHTIIRHYTPLHASIHHYTQVFGR